VLEDKNQKVQVFGLEERLASTPDEMRLIIEEANSIRTTHNTVTNETSSRSHAICNVKIYKLLNLDSCKRSRLGRYLRKANTSRLGRIRESSRNPIE